MLLFATNVPCASRAPGNARGDALHPFEERAESVPHRDRRASRRATRGHHEHVALEHRRTIEERNRDLVVEHHIGVRAPATIPQNTHPWSSMSRQSGAKIAMNAADRAPPRIRHPCPSDPSPEVLELYDKGGLRAPDGTTLNIFATLAHHPALLRRWLVFANARDVEEHADAARSRTAHPACRACAAAAPYEFGQHHVIAQRVDVTSTRSSG